MRVLLAVASRHHGTHEIAQAIATGLVTRGLEADAHGCDTGSDLLDGADRLVAEDRPRRRLRHVAFENVQVGAADRAGVDADDDVRRLLDLGIVN